MTDRARAGALSALGIEPLEDASPAKSTQSVVPSDPISGGRRSALEAIGIFDDEPVSAPIAPAAPLPVEPETPGFLETMGTLVAAPTSTDAFPEGIGKATDAILPDPIQRGFIQGVENVKLGANVATGGIQKNPYEAIDALASTANQLAQYPMDEDTQQALSQMTKEGGTWGNFFDTLFTKGGAKAAGVVTLESLARATPALLSGGVTTLATGNPFLGGAATIAPTFVDVYGSELRSEISKTGLDVNNPDDREAIAAVFQDKAFWERANKSAVAAGVPISVVNALSFGLAGKFIAPVLANAGNRTMSRNILLASAATMGEAALQGGLGATGETLSQLGQMGVGTRDKFNVGEIGLEAVAEMPIGAVEAVPNVISATEATRVQREQNAAIEADAKRIIGQAFDPTPGQGININMEMRSRAGALEAIGLNVPDEEISATAQPVQTASLSPSITAAEPEVPATETPVLADPVETPQNETAPAGQPLTLEPNPRITNTAAASNRREITTVDQSEAVMTRPVIVELEDLKQAAGELQPRDRSLAESDSGVRTRAVNLDPRQLGDSPIGDSGAPIILSDGTILSGNGRALTLREVYTDQDLVQQRISYKAFLRDYMEANKGQATPITDKRAGKLQVDIANMKQPVLVMQIEGDITTDAAVRFAQGNNLDRTARMGATEQAQLDADRLTDDMLRVYMGGDIESRDNKMFLDAFSRDIVAENERGAFSRDGRLTKEGAQRIEAAILAKTYKDTGVLANMLESRDDNIRNITSAMLGASPAFAQLQGEIAAGRIEADFDITPAIVEVAKTISRLRNEGVKVKDFLAQQDAFSDLDPLVEALIVAFYDGNRALSAKKLTQVLNFYIEEASQKEAGGFFEDDTSAQDIVRVARDKVNRGERSGDSDQVSFIDQSPAIDAAQPIQNRRQAERPAAEKRSANTEKRREESAGRSQEKLDNQVALANQPDKVIDTRTRSTGVVEEVEQSMLADVFVAAGYPVNAAITLPPKRQIKIITDTFEQRFGLKVIVKDNANVKSVINKLMQGYVAFENMAHALQMPPKVLGLNGTLRYYIDGGSPGHGALAYYNSGTKEIHQAVESNVFAHEWFHALDYWIMDSYGSGQIDISEDKEAARGQSAAVRKARKETKPFRSAAPQEVKQAFERVMRTLYVDAEAEAAKIMDLEKEISRLEAKQRDTGKQYKSLEQARTRLQQIMEGRSSVRLAKTPVNEATTGDQYLNRPTEMFARFGEAFVGRQLELLKSETDLATPGDAWYDTLAEDFVGKPLEKPFIQAAYPQAEQRLLAFGAYADLMQALYDTGAFGERNPLDTGVQRTQLDPMASWRVTPDRYTGSPLKRITDDINRQHQQRRNAQEQRKKKMPEINHNRGLGLSIWEKYDAFTNKTKLSTKDGNILSISGRYANIKLMQDLRKLTTYNPGGMDGTVSGGTVYDKTQQRMNEFGAKLAQITKRHNLDTLPLPVQVMLRDFLIGQEDTIDLAIKYEGADYNLAQPAAELRQLLDQIYTYSRKAGVKLGYLADGGYLPRILDDVAVFENEAQFKVDAAKVYELMFTNEVGEFNGSAEQFDLVAARATKDVVSRLSAEVGYNLKMLKKQRKDGAETLSKVDIVDGDPVTRDAEFELLEIYEAVKTAEAELNADNWFLRIGVSMTGDPAAGTAKASFTKARKLPPEADKIMERYYQDQPIVAIQQYILGATRKAEFERAFGLQNIPEGEGKPEYGDYLDYARVELVRQGVHPQDAGRFIDTIRLAAGQNKYAPMRNSDTAYASDWAAAGVTVPLLGAATISSLAEPLTTAFQTGNAIDGLRSLGFTLEQLWQQTPWLGNRDKFEALDQVARIMGAAQDYEFGDIIQNRLGSQFMSDSSINSVVTKFFIGNLLAPVTNAQRRSQVRIFSKLFYELATELKALEGKTDSKSVKKANRAKRMLQDFGINEADLEGFVEYVIDINTVNGKPKYRLPTIDDLVNDRGEIEGVASLYTNAISRASRMTIQDPQPGQRGILAEHPAGRIIFAITSFIYAFQRNVLIKSAKSIIRDASDNGKLAATEYAFMRVVLPALMLFAGHTAVSLLREFIYNRERWDKNKDNDDFWSKQLLTGMSRSGYFGAFDPVVNGFLGLKYQRDLSSSVVGAGSYYLTSIGKMGNTMVNDNPNSLYDEYQAWQGVYEMFAVPAMSFGFALAPVPDFAKQTLFYPALLSLRSADAKKEFAQTMVETFNGKRYVPRDQRNKRRRQRRRRDSR